MIGGHVPAYGAIEGMRPSTRKAAAALALHGQPFGCTWAMVDAIRECANGLRRLADDTYNEAATADAYRTAETAEQAADHLAALLPPR